MNWAKKVVFGDGEEIIDSRDIQTIFIDQLRNIRRELMYTGEDNLKTAYVNLKWRYQEGSWKYRFEM